MRQFLNQNIVALIVAMTFAASAQAQTGPGGVGSSEGASTLEIWLDAESTGLANGTALSTWSDLSGKNNHFTQAVADSQPSVVTGVMNGFRVVRFDGVQDHMLSGAIAGLNTDQISAFVVYEHSAALSGDENILRSAYLNAGESNSHLTWGFFFSATTITFNGRNSSGGIVSATKTPSTTSPAILTGMWRASNAIDIYHDGASGTPGSGADLVPSNHQRTVVGASSIAAPNSFLNGDVAEVIVFASELTSAERQIVENYLSAKYNIAISNDLYAGDDAGNGNYDYDVIGIGKESDGTHDFSRRGGLILTDNNALNANGEYLLTGHNGVATSLVQSDISPSLSGRWSRIWYFDKTGTLDGAPVRVGFDFGESGIGGTPGNQQTYVLLYRSGTSGSFSVVATSGFLMSGDEVTFEVTDANLPDGYYTLGIADAPQFAEVGGSVGLGDTGNGRGVAWGDYDGDGYLDVYLTKETANVLYKNNGMGGFDAQAGVAADAGDGRSATWADVDDDGDLDLLVTNSGNLRLYINDGNGGFDLETRGLTSTAIHYTATWADYDRDGDLDVYIAVHGGANLLYQNDGTGNFTDVASSAEVSGSATPSENESESATWGDYNNDGYPDLYVANYYADNVLYANDGDGTFTNVTTGAEVAGAAGETIGAFWGDYNNDGYLDLYVVNNSTTLDHLYHNEGDGTFIDIAFSAGISNDLGAVSAAWGDYNNDGYLDLYVNRNGYSNLLWLNNGDGTFVNVSVPSNTADSGSGRGMAWADFDNDGHLDLYVVNVSGADRFYKNNGHATNKWLQLDLTGNVSNGFGVGAQVRAWTGSNQRLQFVDGGAGWNSQPPHRLHFGLGSSATVDSVVVAWQGPGGKRTLRTEVSTNQILEIFENDPPVGNFGYALSFNGTSGYVEVPSSSSLNNYATSDELTVEYWVYPRSNTANQDFISKRNSSNVGGFVSETKGSGAVRNFVRMTNTAGSNNTIDPDWPFVDVSYVLNEWVHFAYTYKDGEGLKAYKNGVLVHSVNVTGDLNAVSAVLRIGKDSEAGNAMYSNAIIDEVRIWSVARTQSQIRSAMGTVLAGSESGLDGYWRFDEGAGTTAYDRTANDNDGTIYNAPFVNGPNATIVVSGLGQFVGRLGGADIDGDDLTFSIVTNGTKGTAAVTNVENGAFTYTPTMATSDADSFVYRVSDGAVHTDVTVYVTLVPAAFTDVTTSPLNHQSTGRGAAWGDLTGNEYLDLYIANVGVNKLFRNDDGNSFTDITTSAGVGDGGNGHGVALGDYNNDGDLDIYVANNGQANRLYRNNGDETFTDVGNTAGVDDSGGGYGVSWVDYDRDGHLDLYIARSGAANILYRNSGNGISFTNESGNVIIDDSGNSKGHAWGDYDNNGYPDLYIANNGNNKLFRNDGGGGFSEVTASPGNLGGDSQGAVWFDYDNDGHLDLFVLNYGTADKLFHNDGNGGFQDVGATAGVEDTGQGHEVGWADFDNDGRIDLYVGRVGEENRLYWNRGDGTFDDVAGLAGVNYSAGTGGLSWGDYDNDGFMDLYVVNVGNTARNRLYRNGGNTNRYLEVILTGVESNRSGIGAVVRTYKNNQVQRRDVDGGSGTFSQASLPVEFGFGSTTTLDSLTVSWPSGARNKMTNVATNQFLEITENRAPVGNFGYALSFNGVDSRVDIAAKDFSNASGFTVEAWVKPADIINNSPHNIIRQQQNGSEPDFRLAFGDNGNSLLFSLSTAGQGWLEWGLAISPGNFTNGEWHHIAATYDGAQKRLYVNGVLIGSQATTGAIAYSPSAVATIGAMSHNGGSSYSEFFNGAIDDVRVWSVARTPEEILQMKDAVLSGFDSGLMGYWRFDDGAGTLAKDHSPEENDGTVHNADWAFADHGAKILVSGSGGYSHFLGGADADSSDTLTFSIVSGGTKGTAVMDNAATGEFTYTPTMATIGVDSFAYRISDGAMVVEQTVLVSLISVSFSDVTDSPLNMDVAGRGVAWGDFDGDGFLDLFVANNGSPNKLFRNTDGSFSDVSLDAGVEDGNSNSHAVALGDVNHDGLLDIYVTNYNQANRLYLNNGDDTFDEVAENWGVNSTGPDFGASWVDYDLDGQLDLYVIRYGAANVLYRNTGAGTFTDMSGSIPAIADEGLGKGYAWGDYNNDGYPDLYVVNDGANKLYRNDGNHVFVEVTASPGGLGGNGQGAAWADYDNDGHLDLFVANRGSADALFRNDGNGGFQSVGVAAGVADAGSGYEVSWVDVDNDGYIDLYVGRLFDDNLLYMNRGDGTFVEVADNAGVAMRTGTGGMAWGDYDNDGFPDLYVTHADFEIFTGSNKLYRNNGNANRYLHVALTGTVSNRSAIGAVVRTHKNNQVQRRDVDGGSGAFSHGSLPVEFGFGSSLTVDSLTVDWPSGSRNVLTNVGTNPQQMLEITENHPPVAAGFGGTLTLDGNDYLEVADQASLRPSSEITIEAWFKYNTLPEAYSIILGKEVDFGSSHDYLLAIRQSDQVVHGRIKTNDSWHEFNSQTTLTAEKWHHVAVTYDGSYLKVYLDGKLDVQEAWNEPLNLVSTSVMHIGRRPIDGTLYFSGELDEVRIWSVARTQSEIRAAMGRELNGAESGLAAYWPFNEGGGTVAEDASANNNQAVFGASPNDPEWTNGRTAPYEGVLNGYVRAVDGDVEDALTFSLLADGTKGSASLQSNGQFTYTPNAGQSGSDSFVFEVSDGQATDVDTVHVVIQNPPVQETTVASGLSGATIGTPGADILIFKIGVTGDGVDSLHSVTVTIGDLEDATGLSGSDLTQVKLFRSSDGVLGTGDVLIGTQSTVNVGSSTTVEVAEAEVIPETETFYIVAVSLNPNVLPGKAFKVGFAAGDVATSFGGVGSAVAASDDNRINISNVRETTVAAGVPGPMTAEPGDEVRIFSIGLRGDNGGTLSSIGLTILDLTDETGLEVSDFEQVNLYRSADALLDDADVLIGSQSSVVIGGVTTVAPTSQEAVPATETFYIATAVLAEDAVPGRAFRVGFAAGGAQSPTGAKGTVVVATDGNAVTIVAPQMLPIQETTLATGLAGVFNANRRAEVPIFRIGLTGDGEATLDTLKLTVSDLSASTGLVSSDFYGLKLYRSTDNILDGNDVLIGKQAAVGIGAPTAIVPGVAEVVPDEQQIYIVAAVIDSQAVAGRAFKVGFDAGGVRVGAMGVGSAVIADDAHRIEVQSGVAPWPDLTGDGAVDFSDFFAFAGNFGKASGDTGFNANVDFVPNGRINFDDFIVFALNFGKNNVLDFTTRKPFGASANSGVVARLDLDSSGNNLDDGILAGTVTTAGSTIKVQVFGKDLSSTTLGAHVEFGVDPTKLKVTAATGLQLVLGITDTSVTFGSVSPVALAGDGLIGEVTLTAQADLTHLPLVFGLKRFIISDHTGRTDFVDVSGVPKIALNGATPPGAIFETVAATGLSGSIIGTPGADIPIYRIGLTGDGVANVRSVKLGIFDLASSTGLAASDFAQLKLFRSSDASLGAGDVLIGTQNTVIVGSPTTIAATNADVPANGVQTFYIVAASLNPQVLPGKAFKVGTMAGNVLTSSGGMGSAVGASDDNRINISNVRETTVAVGLSGQTEAVQGTEVTVFAIGLTGDGGGTLSAIGLTISDLTDQTGLEPSDFAQLNLYRSSDGVLNEGDELIGTQSSVSVGSVTTIAPTSSEAVPATETFYIATAVLAEDAVPGRAFRVGFAAGGAQSPTGAKGTAVGAQDINSVTIVASNVAPVASAQTVEGLEDADVVIALSGTDADGDSLTAIITTLPVKGALYQTEDGILRGAQIGDLPAAVTNASRRVIYAPPADSSGSPLTTFAFKVNDGALDSETSAVVTVNMTSVNDSPTLAAIDNVTILEDAGTQTVTLSGISAGGGETQTLTVTATSSRPSLIPNPVVSYTSPTATGTLTFTPVADSSGVATISVTVQDDGGTANGGVETFVRTFTVTVTPVEDAPIAVDNVYEILEDTPTALNVRSNDRDPDGDPISIVSVTTVTGGTAQIMPDSTILFTPTSNFFGSGGFFYAISDGKGNTASASVSITILPVNDPPVANPDAATTQQGQAVTIPVLANDSDVENQPLSLAGVSTPANGAATVSGSSVVYTPNPEFSGTETFSYEVTDGQATSSGAVTVTVIRRNSPPVVADHQVVLASGVQSANVDVKAGAVDADGDALMLAELGSPANGTVVINSDGTVFYRRNQGFNGQDSFTYTLSDGHGGATTGKVLIEAQAPPGAPVAVSDAAETRQAQAVTINVLANDQDGGAPGLRVTGAGGTGNATVTVGEGGVITYTPNAGFRGTDRFTYTVANGADLTATATVTVTVIGVNQPPVILAFGTHRTLENRVYELDLTPYASDPDNLVSELRWEVLGVSEPVASAQIDGMALRAVPGVEKHGTGSVKLALIDKDGLRVEGELFIFFEQVDDPPVFVAEAFSPADGAANVPRSAILGWQAKDPDTSVLRYSVRLGRVSNVLNTAARDLTVSTYAFRAEFGQTWFYQVVVTDGKTEVAGPVLSFTVEADRRPPVITRVDAVEITETGARVVWVTDKPGTSQVRFGRTADLSDAADVFGADGLDHSVVLPTLAPDAVYHYQVVTTDNAGNVGRSDVRTFATLRARDVTPPSFVAGPFVEGVDDKSAGVRFDVNEMATAVVTVTGGAGQSLAISKPGLSQFGRIEGLTPSTNYEVVVAATDAAGNTATSAAVAFRTRAAPDVTPPVFQRRPDVVAKHIAASVSFGVNEPSTAVVKYGLSVNALTLEATASAGIDFSLTLPDLDPNTPYVYELTVADLAGNKLLTSGSFKTLRAPDVVPPVILQGPSAQGVTQDQVTISWKTDEPAFSRVVYDTLALSDRSFRTALTGAVSLDHAYRLSGLATGKTYSYQVISVDAAGNASTSGADVFTTRMAPDTRPPVLTSNPVASGIGFDRFTVEWRTDEASTSEVTAVPVTSPGQGQVVQELLPVSRTLSVPVQSHSVALTGLAAGTVYRISIRSVDAAKNAMAQDGVLTVTTLRAPDVTPPKIVGLPEIQQVTDSQARIAWRTDEPADRFVEVDTLADFSTAQRFGATTPGVAHVVTATNLTEGKTHFYRVFSTDVVGNGPTRYPLDAPLTFRTLRAPDRAPPVIQEGPVATAISQNSATVQWALNEPADAVVLYATSESELTTGAQRAHNPSLSAQHAMALTGLEAGTRYVYRVASTDAAKNGPTQSGVRSFTTLKAPDTQAPKILAGPSVTERTENSALVEWQTDEPATTEVEYNGLRNSRSEGAMRHRMQLTNLEADTEYQYKIISTDAAGNTTEREGLPFRTPARPDREPPNVLDGPGIDYVSDRQVTIAWTTDEAATSKVTLWPEDDPDNELPPVYDNAFKRNHRIGVPQLEKGKRYAYRIESSDPSGNTVVAGQAGRFKPAPGVVTKMAQPPGGGGSFFTNLEADTQFPVILKGPHVIASTANTLTVEWTTDETGDSEVSFGVDGLALRVESGAHVLAHRVVLTNLEPNTTYQYQVASTDPAGNGATRSRVFLAKTAAAVDTLPPRIVAAPKVIYSTERQATIAWETDKGAQTVLEFGAEVLTDQRSAPDFVTQHQVTLTNLTASTTYRYRVLATDAAGNGPAQSALLTFTTDAEPDRTPPVITRAPAAEVVTNTSALIRWQTNELANSAVRYAEGAHQSESALGLVAGSSISQTSHDVALTNLKPGTTYSFLVQNTDRSGNGPASSQVVTFTTLLEKDETPPPAPVGLSVRGATGRVVVAWTPVEDSGLAGYDVLRAVGEGEFSLIATQVPQAQFVDDGLDGALRYRYRVRAIDLAGNQSDVSAIAEGRADGAGVPTAPVAKGVEGDPLKPTLRIENARSSVPLIYGFDVARDEAFAQVIASVSGIPAGQETTAWTVDVALEDGATYYWRARAFDGVFDGPFMQPARFVAGAEAPVAHPGDFDGDLQVGFSDFLLFAGAFGKRVGDPVYREILDLNKNGAVDFPDFLTFTSLFGTRYSR